MNAKYLTIKFTAPVTPALWQRSLELVTRFQVFHLALKCVTEATIINLQDNRVSIRISILGKHPLFTSELLLIQSVLKLLSATLILYLSLPFLFELYRLDIRCLMIKRKVNFVVLC